MNCEYPGLAMNSDGEEHTTPASKPPRASSEDAAALGLLGWCNRAWRLVATALSFTLFGLGGLVLGLLVFPFFFVLLRDPDKRQRAARKLVGRAFSAFVWIMKSLRAMSYEVCGKTHMRDVRRTVIIANHPSLIDVVFLVAFFPQAECVVKRAVVRNPFMRGTALAANYIANDDPEQLLATCIDRVAAGSSLILFPEGTRRRQDAALKFKPGAAAIAVRSKARLLPVVIECDPPTLRKGEPWYRIPRRRPHWRFEVHPAMEIGDFTDPGDDQRQATRKLQSGLLAFYNSQLDGGPQRGQA